MKSSMKVAVLCYALGSAIGVFMFARYWSANEFMPYHAVISGSSWDSLTPGVQRIVLGLLKAASAGFLATAVAVAALIVPIARGEAWARWTSLAASSASLLPLVYLTASMRIDTGAPAPVAQSVAALALVVAAFIASGVARRETSPHQGPSGRDAELDAR